MSQKFSIYTGLKKPTKKPGSNQLFGFIEIEGKSKGIEGYINSNI
jgi:hypothetical protein